CNAAFLEHELWLVSMHDDIDAIASTGSARLEPKCSELTKAIDQEWARMQLYKEREWMKQKEVRARCELLSFPLSVYLHQDMKHWLARLLARHGLEDIMDDMLKRAASATSSVLSDIWDAPIVCEIRSEDGTRFIDAPIAEGRLIFGMSVDGFNPFQNKQAKQQVSVTAMYLYCLNLPPHLRYLPENMYLVGVVP
ncbi:hypothetical protein C8T65DRAFT_516795, partial [Cerioporus squamosus]